MIILMEEKEALFYRERNSQGNLQRSKIYLQSEDEEREMSSENSEESWEESQDSVCSSCCDHNSASSYEWEKEVNEKGQLFYVESNLVTTPESHSTNQIDNLGESSDEVKVGDVKRGQLLNWMRRRNSKRFQSNKPSQNSNAISQSSIQESSVTETSVVNSEKECKQIILKINSIREGATLCEKFLGLSLGFSKEKKVIVTNINLDDPAQHCKDLATGDIIHKINNYNVMTPEHVENLLQSLNFPCEVFLKIQKTERSSEFEKIKSQSSLVLSLLKKNDALDAALLVQPVGVVVVDVKSQNLNSDDIIYCYPEKCILSSCRGAFVTLYHLLTDIKPNDLCHSSSVIMKKQPTHVLYSSDDNFLMLIAIPQSRYSLKEATYVVHDLIRNMLFNHQTLKRCFETTEKSTLDHFFSLFFSRVLTNGFSPDASQFTVPENITVMPLEPGLPQFEDIMPYATWVPLPKEVQIQIDEALNELEANDFENEEEDSIENPRSFNILGSCFFHKSYLLASHLSIDDLIDVYSFYRQNCLLQLFNNEPVKSLVIWREVYPLSVNRGLPSWKTTNYATPSGRWFLLVVGQGYDSLTVLLEAGECCMKIEGNPGPSVPYIEEAQDTLRHMQKLGISSLASQWIENNSRFKTVTPEEIFAKKANRKKENILGFVKTLDGIQKPSVQKTLPVNSKSYDINQEKRTRGGISQDTSEDSASQTPSNVSEVSDENAPILGRRAERGRILTENLSGDSDSSDSDWDSSRDSNMKESSCSSGVDNFYLCDVGKILPARLTTGPEDILFYYVHLDGNEGVLVNPPLNSKRSSPKMMEILQNFRKSAQIIHSILENNIRFKKTGHDNSKCFINKSLIAVKEHGVIFECVSSESDSNKKPASFTYWIVGKLFFTPQPREIYVCYCEDTPQNLVEIAFRLGLSTAG